MIRTWRQSGIPLYLLITGLVLGGVILTTTLQLINIRRESQIVAQMQASATFELAFHSISDDVARAVEPIIALVDTSAIMQQHTGLTSFAAANDFYIYSSVQALASRKNILAVNYGFADGTFYSVTMMGSEAVRINYKAPPGSVYAVWSVAPDANGVKREWWLYLDKTFRELARRDTPAKYDPRKTPWYRDAMNSDQLVMTDPYIFTTSRQLGMACAKAMGNRSGVYSVNISLSNFNKMLTGISMARTGALFLLDEGLRVVASAVPSVAERVAQGELLHLADLTETEGHGVFEYLLQHNFHTEGSSLATLGGNAWFLQYTPVPMGSKRLNLLLMAPESDYAGFVRNLFLNSALFSLCAMLAATPLAIWLSMRIIGSLRILMRETQRIATSAVGKPEEHVASPIYEVNSLAKAIYRMEETISSRTEALRSMKEQLEVIVAERTRELSVAIVRAEEASQAKSAFLATMSHEIRTPMNAIIGFTHLFEISNLDNRQLDYLGKIRISAEALLTIINDVLDFSKIEARKLTLEHIPFRLRSVVDSVQGIISLAADKKNLQFIVDVNPTVPSVFRGDPTRLHQVLLNLLGNAVKFTQEGTVSLIVSLDPDQSMPPSQPADDFLSLEAYPPALPVAEGYPLPAFPVSDLSTNPSGVFPASDPSDAFSTREERGAFEFGGVKMRLRLEVRDTGIGIAENNLRKLFEPFTQADQSVTRKFGGTGLGLVICKQLLERMQGSIAVESVEGVGTTFTCQLLLELQNEADLEDEKNTLDSATQELAHFAGTSVLVVEDNLINQEIVVAMLEPCRLQVFVTSNGQECLDFIETHHVDMVLMDMQMPVMDGLQATRLLRDLRNADDSFRFPAESLPIIAMTANAMSEDRLACFAAGMNDYISKPVNPENLYERMAFWLERTKPS